MGSHIYNNFGYIIYNEWERREEYLKRYSQELGTTQSIEHLYNKFYLRLFILTLSSSWSIQMVCIMLGKNKFNIFSRSLLIGSSFDPTNSRQISLDINFSQIKWQSISMCLILSWNIELEVLKWKRDIE